MRLYLKDKIVIFIFAFLLLFVGINKINQFQDYNPTVIVENHKFTNQQNKEMLKGSKVTEQFIAENNHLGTISIKFNTHNRINNDYLQFRIKESGSNDWYYSNKYQASKFQNGDYFPFGFPPINDSKDKKYQIEIESLSGLKGNSVQVVVKNAPLLSKYSFPKAYLQQNKKEIPGFLFNKIRSYFNYIGINIFFSLLVATLSLLFLLRLVNVHRLFNQLKKYDIKIIKINKFNFDLFKYSKLFYIVISTILFIFLIRNAPPVICDASEYNDLANKLLLNHLNIFTFNFGQRTFAYPLFLAILKLFANITKINYLYLVFFIQFILFHLTNLLIYSSLKSKFSKVASIFLMLSGFNIITLSFTNILLTENLAIFFATLIFNLLLRNKTKITLFMLGVICSLILFIRPSLISLSTVVFLVLIYELFKNKKILSILFFIVGYALIFSIGLINTYKTTYKANLFNQSTNNIYLGQVQGGLYVLKYETSFQKINPTSQMIYLSSKNKKTFSLVSCDSVIGCLFSYLKKDAVSYISVNLIHLFNIFDRIYVDTYVRNIFNPNRILQLFNYFVISSNIIYFIFINNKSKNNIIVNTAFLIIFGIISIYLPTGVEPRFSSPAFPLLLLITAFYLETIGKIKDRYRYLILNIVFILIFYVISDLTQLQLHLGWVRFYK